MLIPIIFGTTSGFEVVPLIGEKMPLEDILLECSSSEMEICGGESFCVARYNSGVGGGEVTWIGLYRPAKEIGRSRPGGYFGAGVALVDSKAEPALIVNLLRTLVDKVRALALVDDQFAKKLIDVKSAIVLPPEYRLLKDAAQVLTQSDGGLYPGGEVGFVAEESEGLLELIRWAQQGESAEVFAKIFIGSNASRPASRSTIPQRNIYQNFNAAAYDSQQRLDIKNKDKLILKLTKERTRSDENIDNYIKQLKSKEDEEKKLITEISAVQTEVRRLQHYQSSDRRKLSAFFMMGALLVVPIFSLIIYLWPDGIRKLLPADERMPANERMVEQPAPETTRSRGGEGQSDETQERADLTFSAICEEGGSRPSGAQSGPSTTNSGASPSCSTAPSQTNSEGERLPGQDGKTRQNTPTTAPGSNVRPKQKKPDTKATATPDASPDGSGRDRSTQPAASQHSAATTNPPAGMPTQ